MDGSRSSWLRTPNFGTSMPQKGAIHPIIASGTRSNPPGPGGGESQKCHATCGCSPIPPALGSGMVALRQALFRALLAVLCGVAISGTAMPQRIGEARRTADNLMVALREWQGANKPDETLKPIGKMSVKFDGEDRIVEFAWYS